MRTGCEGTAAGMMKNDLQFSKDDVKALWVLSDTPNV